MTSKIYTNPIKKLGMDGLHKESLRKNRPSKPLSGVMSVAIFSYEFPMVQGANHLPPTPLRKQHKREIWDFFCFYIEKKTERKV